MQSIPFQIAFVINTSTFSTESNIEEYGIAICLCNIDDDSYVLCDLHFDPIVSSYICQRIESHSIMQNDSIFI